MGVQILPIPSHEARAVWPLCEHHIVKALEHAHGVSLPEDVLTMVEEARAQLWLAQRSDGHVVAALVTWINHYPRRKTVCVPLIGGSELRTWFRKALLAIESWAVEIGCDSMEGTTRRGWARLANMEESGVTLWKDLRKPDEKKEAA